MTTDNDRYPQRWKPGQSGNPAGRKPSGTSLAEKVRSALAENSGKEGYTNLDALLDVLKKAALAGDLAAIRELLDRGYGKPGESLKLSAGTAEDDDREPTIEELETLLRLRREEDVKVV